MTKVKFLTDHKLDSHILFVFSKQDFENRGGFNVFRELIKEYPELSSCSKLPEAERKIYIEEFVKKEYNLELPKIQKKKKEIENEFNRFKEDFFSASSKIFDGFLWNYEDYSAQFTIWNIYPRNIDKRLAYIPYKTDNSFIIKILIHELMHFIFFDYFNHNFKDKLSKELTWDLSEIINVILLNLPEINKFFNVEEKAFPNHIERYKKLEMIYRSCNSMNEFINESIIFLNKEGDQYDKLSWED